MQQQNKQQSFRWRLLKQVGVYWPQLGLLLLLSTLAPPLALLVPLPLKIAVDSIIDQRQTRRISAAAPPLLPGGRHAQVARGRAVVAAHHLPRGRPDHRSSPFNSASGFL